MSLFKKVDAVLLHASDLEAAKKFYGEELGHELRWQNDDAVAFKLGDSELVISKKLNPEVDLLVDSVEEAIKQITDLGGKVILPPEDLPVGKVGIVQDLFGNKLTLVDLSRGTYKTDADGNILEVS
mgnify:CR=1 FL=1